MNCLPIMYKEGIDVTGCLLINGRSVCVTRGTLTESKTINEADCKIFDRNHHLLFFVGYRCW